MYPTYTYIAIAKCTLAEVFADDILRTIANYPAEN